MISTQLNGCDEDSHQIAANHGHSYSLQVTVTWIWLPYILYIFIKVESLSLFVCFHLYVYLQKKTLFHPKKYYSTYLPLSVLRKACTLQNYQGFNSPHNFDVVALQYIGILGAFQLCK